MEMYTPGEVISMDNVEQAVIQVSLSSILRKSASKTTTDLILDRLSVEPIIPLLSMTLEDSLWLETLILDNSDSDYLMMSWRQCIVAKYLTESMRLLVEKPILLH
jgi:hypothetical protein